jgi:SAM-dependent methyltransferase
MIEQLAATSPGVRPVRGSATAIPLRDDCADLIVSAQAWHWMDPALAVPEFRRILRPGGVFAAWWNYTQRDSAWEREQEKRIDAAAGPDWRAVSSPFAKEGDEMGPHFDLPVVAHAFAWERTISLDTHLDNLVSKSYVAALPNRDEFLATERAILSAQFPDGYVTERFGTHMVTVTVPSAE